MSRYSILEKEINKSIAIDEKAGVEIRGWSPNNVRRLIIGANHAVVQYFVTGGKYSKLVEIVNIGRGMDADVDTLKNEPKKYTGLLKVLTAGRICSSIEEIIICTQDYQPELMNLDINLSLLINNDGNTLDKLANRFVRLRHISKVNAQVSTIYELLGYAKKPDQLLLDILPEKGIQVDTLFDIHKEDWWRGTYLRGRLYLMDREGELLDRYFSKLLTEMNTTIRENKLTELDFKKNAEFITKEYPAISAICTKILQIAEQANEIFVKAPVMDKLQWANFLSYDNMGTGIRRELFMDGGVGRNMTSETRSIDTDKVTALIDKIQLDSKAIKDFMNYVYSYCLTREAPKVRDMLDIANSLRAVKFLLTLVLNTQVNIVYLSLVKFYLKSGLKHVEFHSSKLSEALAPDLLYTRSVVEYMNKILPVGDAKQCLDTIGATEILAEEFKSIPLRMQLVTKILSDLTQVVEPTSSRRGNHE